MKEILSGQRPYIPSSWPRVIHHPCYDHIHHNGHFFIDDEINSSERVEIMEAITNHENLSYRVCELLQLKDTVRLDYS
jgi:hypothetical protein